MSSVHQDEDEADFIALENDEDSSSGKTHPTPIKHMPVDLVCCFHHNLPDLENINPTFLGPENELTHCPCVVVFGGTETFGAYMQTNSMYVLECGNIASRNQVVSLCNQEQINCYADGKLISNQKGNDKYEYESSTSKFSLQWKKIEYGSSEQIPSAREFPCLSYERHSQKCYLFGGYGGHYFNDVWEFNLRNKTWTRLVTQGNVPSARCGCSGMANRFGLVVFGGYNGTYLDDFFFGFQIQILDKN
ncbi:hypothetical protein FDP41_013514 [Naegleria fowleri]|uniref:Uncharacterized protein n=1 Tax=Naegleria fowleri TaxID=5763 RepID=A0A6A5C358_NAEFO|nr:uncharacterized protein FDP41_013514 [Naegleria fowleri]KAF0980300.1 hypothetical protein FDP41_013514 [Naegleria fowleri]